MQRFALFLLGLQMVLCFKSMAQCLPVGCNRNSGLNSNNQAASIEYDNMVVGFHSTIVKEESGVWKVWGESMHQDGITHLFSPVELTTANYPFTGTILKATIGSVVASGAVGGVQWVVLTTDGLFASGNPGVIMDASITTSKQFQKINVGGNPAGTGLPLGVAPLDVKMLTASGGFLPGEPGALMLTTCNGRVFTLANTPHLRGNGSTGSFAEWSQVMESAGNPLLDVIVARTNGNGAVALKSDGTLWTWGKNVYLGNGTIAQPLEYAQPMAMPSGLPKIKMVRLSAYYSTSYWVLGTDGRIYGLGDNYMAQLGNHQRQVDHQTQWTLAKNPDGSIITDAVWISSGENDNSTAFVSNVSLLKSSGMLYTGGANHDYSAGQLFPEGINGQILNIPQGISATDRITLVASGGHSTAVVRQGTPRYGYVGHCINGSMGDPSCNIGGNLVEAFDFVKPPEINVCGTHCVPPSIEINTRCNPSTPAIFTIIGEANSTITYQRNGGAATTLLLNSNGRATLQYNTPLPLETITITHLESPNCTPIDTTITATSTETPPPATSPINLQ